MRGGTSQRQRRRGSGPTGLVSTIGPVAVGVVLAFAWNMTVSQPERAAQTAPGVTPQVGLTVEEAAVQAWASVTPRAATGDVRRPSP